MFIYKMIKLTEGLVYWIFLIKMFVLFSGIVPGQNESDSVTNEGSQESD